MQEIIDRFAEENHIDMIRAVDITSLSLEENRGFFVRFCWLKFCLKSILIN